VSLDDADKIKLHEIESHLERDRRIASVFGHRRGPIRRPLSLLVLGATAVFVAALVALSILTADAVPGLLAIVPATAALLVVRRRLH
jgi:Protein of unknown function (DUF3040)